MILFSMQYLYMIVYPLRYYNPKCWTTICWVYTHRSGSKGGVELIEVVRIVFPSFLYCCFNVFCMKYITYLAQVFEIIFSFKWRWLLGFLYFVCCVYFANTISNFKIGTIVTLANVMVYYLFLLPWWKMARRFTILHAFDGYARKGLLDYEMIQRILHMCKKIL